MILHGENRVFPVLHPFDGAVVEVKVRDLKRLGTGDAARVTPDREAVVLRRDKYLSGRKIPYWMVPPPMPIRELCRLPPERQTEQLVAQADAEDGEGAIGEGAQRGNRVGHPPRIPRPVRGK